MVAYLVHLQDAQLTHGRILHVLQGYFDNFDRLDLAQNA